MGSSQYNTYERGGFHIDIPSWMQIKSEIPNLFATSDDQEATLAVEIDPEAISWDASEEIIRQPLAINPMIESRIVREGQTLSPYPGYERIVEHLMKPTGKSTFAWFSNFSTNSTKVLLQVGDTGNFSGKKSLWTHVIESIRITPD